MQQTEEPSDRYRAPALDKGLDILELLSTQPRGLTRAEIVKAMDRGPSEIYRMLERLVAREYVRRTSEGDRYELSTKMFMLASRHPPFKRFAAQAAPLMDQFAFETRQSCHLVIAEHGSGLVIAQASPSDAWEFKVRIGAVLNLLDSASGLTLLAFQSAATRVQSLEPWRNLNTVDSLVKMEPHLAEISQIGYRSGESRQLKGVLDISVPIFGVNREAFAVITCACLQRQDNSGIQDTDQIHGRLQQIAAELSIT